MFLTGKILKQTLRLLLALKLPLKKKKKPQKEEVIQNLHKRLLSLYGVKSQQSWWGV